jgi:hypothetical protein
MTPSPLSRHLHLALSFLLCNLDRLIYATPEWQRYQKKKGFPAPLPKSRPQPQAVAMAPAQPKSRNRSSARTSVAHKEESNAYSYNQVISSLHDLQNGLVNVQHGITSLLDSYRKHCHTVLGYEEGEAAPYSNDISALGAAVSAASVLEAGQKAIEEVTQGLGDKAGDASKSKKRKREKKERDPNAPKKPLTAAFLYHQHARPIVKADLEAALPPGGQIEKNAVQIEVNKRWNELSEEEKEVSMPRMTSYRLGANTFAAMEGVLPQLHGRVQDRASCIRCQQGHQGR